MQDFANKFWLVDNLLHITPGFYVFVAVLLMVLPVPWVLAALLAAAWHELFHIAAIICMDVHIEKIHIKAGGAEIVTPLSGGITEFLVALAGPVGSFLLLFPVNPFPKLAVCGLVQGIYNMIPICPLDGGRTLYCFLTLLNPKWAEKIMNIIECLFVSVIVMLSVYSAVCLKLGMFQVFVVIVSIAPWIRRKIPCKQGEIRVQ